MTRFQYYVASSLDGFIADRDDKLDWLLAFGFAEFDEHYQRFLGDVGALVLGASTYRFMLDQGPDAWTYDVPAWVLTTSDLPAIGGRDIRFAGGDVASLRSELVEAAGGRNVWVIGGGATAAQLSSAGMLDDLFVTVMPVVLGAGVPVLPVDRMLKLTHTRTTAFPSGAVELAYEVAGTD